MAAKERRPRLRYGDGRQALLDAVVRVVGREGLAGVTNRAVAEEAGVTHGLVRHHFGSREDLLHEALVRAARDSIHLSHLEAESGRLEDFATDLAALVADDPDRQSFQFEFVLEARRRAALASEAQGIYDAYLEATERALERLGLPTSPGFTRLVFAALDGLVMQQLVYGRPADTEAALRELKSLLGRLASNTGDCAGGDVAPESSGHIAGRAS